jgi:hypothetical protein
MNDPFGRNSGDDFGRAEDDPFGRAEDDPFGRAAGDPFAPQPAIAWFGRKRYGYGWGPRTWQGWLITGALLVFAIFMTSASKGHGALLAVGLVPLVAVPLIIAWLQQQR